MPLIAPARRTRFFLSLLILVVLAGLFWTGSRYPSLNEKAMMSGALQLEDALSFEARFEITAEMGLLERLFFSTLNWIDTNKKGMTFGILFAAAFLTAAANLTSRSFRGGFSNALLGLGLGAPLGVCVNCAAPIAKGMYAAGLRAETTMAAMIASPTLNVVVLTMAFSLLPAYMALTKIALSLGLILIVVPLVARLLPQKELPPEAQLSAAAPQAWSAAELGSVPAEAEAFLPALAAVARAYVKNLWYIIKLTVPLMLLAGFLGTLVAVLLPGELILGLEFSALVLALVVLVGVFLPVPIGFDVVMAGGLLATGLSQGYVMALLFTLGSFSVYSYFIMATSLGQRAALSLSFAVALAGFGAGLGTDAYHRWQSEKALELLLQGDATGHVPAPLPARPLWGAAMADTPSVTVTSTPLSPPQGHSEGQSAFIRQEAWEIGIDKPVEFTMRDMWPPFWEGRSLASGDIDNDGDLDLVVASTETGLYLYANDGSGQFSRIPVDLGPLAERKIFNAALVDLDNDGWRDLFLTSYLEGNFLWRNQGGQFSGPPQPVQNRADTPLTLALSFADVDRDGDLDVALGNWAAGWYRRIPGEESRNRLLWNPGAGQPFTGAQYTDLPGLPGETLSILFSDLDRDGAADLLVGNDFDIPDYFYRGDGAGGFAMIGHGSGMIPYTTTTTMALKVADLMNDGQPEVYMAQIAGRASGVSERLKMQPLAQYCDAIKDPAAKATCARNMAIKDWYKSGNNFDPTYAARCQQLSGRYAEECRAMLVKDLAIQKRDAKVCALIPATQVIPRAYCDLHFKPTRPPLAEEIALTHPQRLRANVLLEQPDAGAPYADTAVARGLEVGGWSWDTKVFDADLDGHLDVYIVNGTWVPNEVSPSNLFFHNQGDGGFAEASGPFGLEDYLMTAAATQMDIDGDGDLDLLTHPVNGPLVVFRNTMAGRDDAHALVLRLRDQRGNRDGIGAVVTAVLPDGQRLSREIQLGGGFMSFDAPEVHFGLGPAAEVSTLEIRWPDGSTDQLAGPFPAGQRYQVERQ